MEENFFQSDVEKNNALNKILGAYVRARDKIGFPTNAEVFDEDVNVYIAHLLFAFAMPNYSYIVEQYISMQPNDIKMLIDMAEDEYFKYFIYKVNGDNLLIHFGLFDDIRAIQYGQVQQGLPKAVDYRELASFYYQKAAEANRKIHKRKTALSDVLLKIVQYFDRYAEALSRVRREYYQFYDVFEDDEFSQFLGAVREYERTRNFQEKQDEFLGLYALWLKKKSRTLRTRINHLCNELHSLDKTFSFHLDDQ